MALDLQQAVFQGVGAKFFSFFALILALGVFGAITMAGVWGYGQVKKYDVVVRIYSKRKNGYKTWDDKGAFLKNKKTGEVYGFKLKKDKTMLQPPPLDALIPTSKGGNVLHLLQLSNDEYFVLNPCIEDPSNPDLKVTDFKLKVIEGDIQLWMTSMIDKL